MIYVRDIIEICNGDLVCGDLDLKCVNFCKDTREINVGDVYVGICHHRKNEEEDKPRHSHPLAL